jgi:hypothetical protein
MSLESDLFAIIGPLVGGRAFPDFGKLGVQTPYATYEQAGGQAVNFLASVPVGKRNARIQVNCWSTSRVEVNALARSVEDALMTSSLKAYSLGAFSVESNSDLNLRGTRQDFSVWY